MSSIQFIFGIFLTLQSPLIVADFLVSLLMRIQHVCNLAAAVMNGFFLSNENMKNINGIRIKITSSSRTLCRRLSSDPRFLTFPQLFFPVLLALLSLNNFYFFLCFYAQNVGANIKTLQTLPQMLYYYYPIFCFNMLGPSLSYFFTYIYAGQPALWHHPFRKSTGKSCRNKFSQNKGLGYSREFSLYSFFREVVCVYVLVVFPRSFTSINFPSYQL